MSKIKGFIREFKQRDFKYLVPHIQDSRYTDPQEKAYLERWWKDFWERWGGFVFIPSGSITPKGFLTSEFSMLQVAPEYQNKGIGTRLVQHGIQIIREKGGTGIGVESSSPESTVFWESLGLVKCDPHHPLFKIPMCKSLDCRLILEI